MKKFCVVFVVGLFLITFMDVANGKDIKPFGDLTWQDSLVEVLSKINNIEGIEKVNLRIGMYKINVKGIAAKDEIERELNAVSKATEGGFDKVAILADHRLSLENYKEIGKKVLRSGPFVVEAFPIMVANIPFTIYIPFTNSIGLTVQSPEKAIMLKSTKHGSYYLPLIIDSVTLTSKLPSLDKNFVKLKEIIKKKYGKFGNKRCIDDKDSFSFKVKDKQGTTFKMVASTYAKRCTIVYNSMAYEKRLKEIYNNYLSESRKESHKGKKDMSSDL